MARAEELGDMYDVLGVTPDADAHDIRRVYRERIRALRLAISPEPDADERLRELTHAYAVLSNPRSRLLYDRLALRGEPTRTLTDVGDEELALWVFGDELREEARVEQPPASPAMTLPSADLLARSFAAVGFVIALFLLVILLLQG